MVKINHFKSLKEFMDSLLTDNIEKMEWDDLVRLAVRVDSLKEDIDEELEIRL